MVHKSIPWIKQTQVVNSRVIFGGTEIKRRREIEIKETEGIF